MPQEIYNEGRVVGLSAWELFMREALNNGVLPEDIPDEHEWLASMIGMGASMILRVPANTSAGIHDYDLPVGSNLTSAGIIIASPFLGACEWNSSTWATKVTSYSPLIKNESGSGNYPTSNNVPYDNTYSTATYQNIASEFIKITDGIVFTNNANWIQTQDGNPYEDIDPNFNESSTTVRLYIDSDIKYDTQIILTGFSNKRVLQGLSGYATEDSGYSIGGSTDTDHNNWKNGGMLGPEIIPWSSKIIFTMPNTTYSILNSLTRKIPSDTTYTAKTVGGIEFKQNNGDSTVKTNSLIDFNSINLGDYFTQHSSEYTVQPTLSENVTAVALGNNDSYNTVVAWYPGMTAAKIKAATNNSQIFPPAVYATQVTATGSQTLVPLDTAAPGTVKCFETTTQAYNYKQLMPYNYAIYHNPTTNMFSFVTNSSDPNNWIGTAKLEYLTAPKAKITVGSNNAQFIAMTNSSGTAYATTGASGTTTATAANRGKITWDNLLGILTSNKTFDTMGDRLRKFATELDSNNIGVDTTNNPITNIKSTNIAATNITSTSDSTNTLTLVPGTSSKTTTITSDTVTNGSVTKKVTKFSNSIKLGENFIEFSNGKRLYIGDNPGTSGIPTGSIGIGW